MTETTNQPTARDRAIVAIDAAEKALHWTTSLGRWEPVRDYLTGRRGLVKHRPTGDDLAEFVYPADAEHASLWHPRRIKALIDRDRATLERHKPNPLSDDACPCGWEYDECPESNAVIAFWLTEDLPAIPPAFDDGNVAEVLVEVFSDATPEELQDATGRVMALITGKRAS